MIWLVGGKRGYIGIEELKLSFDTANINKLKLKYLNISIFYIKSKLIIHTLFPSSFSYQLQIEGAKTLHQIQTVKIPTVQYCPCHYYSLDPFCSGGEENKGENSQEICSFSTDKQMDHSCRISIKHKI